ncbi:2-hydroxy-6-oxononadienedioate/2-hydroxy-6-oxononatrienedioate hydrolase [Klebsiella huaxiensis]|uniref:alpha/beta fold hydrolase n=1 Tax=Klebsiella huaxiensis TaxID=2153354 RepID=UPI001157BD81|nr:alpha/beta hydrolase [Klebsiella huaxiensis]VUT20743.1 2-hydroxy-6-oxononadienedioate/2-hydroxy-6-oxononatrienedioate hydrolase [Klebsiella huaxiensis]
MNSFFSSQAGATVRWLDLPGRGEPIVFIHGLGCASTYDYPRVAADPALAGRRMLLVDLPGYGYSDKPASFGYRTGDQAKVVVELLEHLALTRCYLYGHSMGGSIAIEAAELLAERVLALLVAEPNLYPGGGMYSRRIAERPEERFIAQGYGDMLSAETSPWAGCLQNSAPWAVWRGASSLVKGVTPSWFTRFSALACRKALVYGELSLPAQEAIDVKAVGIPLFIVPQAGHSMAWENPSALAQTVADFYCSAEAERQINDVVLNKS